MIRSLPATAAANASTYDAFRERMKCTGGMVVGYRSTLMRQQFLVIALLLALAVTAPGTGRVSTLTSQLKQWYCSGRLPVAGTVCWRSRGRLTVVANG